MKIKIKKYRDYSTQERAKIKRLSLRRRGIFSECVERNKNAIIVTAWEDDKLLGWCGSVSADYYGMGTINMTYTRVSHRRRGIGTKLAKILTGKVTNRRMYTCPGPGSKFIDSLVDSGNATWSR